MASIISESVVLSNISDDDNRVIISLLCNESNLSSDELQDLVVNSNISKICKPLEGALATRSIQIATIEKNIYSTWNFLYKYQFKNNQKIKFEIIKYIYEELAHMLHDVPDYISSRMLIEGTCIICNLTEDTNETICVNVCQATKKDHHICLKYLHKDECSVCPKEKKSNYAMPGCILHRGPCEIAARCGRLACLRYLNECRCTFPRNTYNEITRGGHIDCLIYLIKNRKDYYGDINEVTCSLAAKGGHIDCLRYLVHKKCKMNSETCNEAVKNNHMDCLQFAIQNGCKTDDITSGEASKTGSLECLTYLCENGCEMNEHTCNEAAKSGQLICLKYAIEHGCKPTIQTCSSAAANGHLDCLKYLHEIKCKWNVATTELSAKNGYIDCFRYAVQNGCRIGINAGIWSLKNGHIDCLKYAMEHGCQVDKDACDLAVNRGHFECIKYAIERGCMVNMKTINTQIIEKKLRMLYVIHEKNGNEDEWNSNLAAVYERLECIKYIHDLRKNNST